MSKVTYGRLDEVLRSLGFSTRTATMEAPARVYEHEGTGALIALPVFSFEAEVLPRHLLASRAILDAYGLADPLDFAAKLEKAS